MSLGARLDDVPYDYRSRLTQRSVETSMSAPYCAQTVRQVSPAMRHKGVCS